MMWPASAVMLLVVLVLGCGAGATERSDGHAAAQQANASQGTASPGASTSTGNPSARAHVPAPAAIGAPETFPVGPPFGYVWCTRTRSYWSDEMRTTHWPAGAVMAVDERRDQCSAGVSGSWGDSQLGVRVSCGDRYYLDFLKDRRARATMDAALGGMAFAESNGGGVSVLHGWDQDTPCYVATGGSIGSSVGFEERARALMKDVLARLTPQSISRPRAELVYMAEDTTGDAARAALATWPQKKSAFDFVAPLAEGYPRIARSDEFPELTPGKYFLLFGACHGGQGEQLLPLLAPAYPPLPAAPNQDRYSLSLVNVDGAGVRVACPERLMPRDSIKMSSSEYDPLPDERMMALTAFIDSDPNGGPVLARLASVLFDKERHVLSYKTVEVPRPVDGETQGRFAPRTTRRYDNCRGTIHDASTFGMGCDVHLGDFPCRGRAHSWGATYRFSATANNTIELDVRENDREGNLCQALE